MTFEVIFLIINNFMFTVSSLISFERARKMLKIILSFDKIVFSTKKLSKQKMDFKT